MFKDHEVKLVVALYDVHLDISVVALLSGKSETEVHDILVEFGRSNPVKLGDALKKYYPPIYWFALKHKVMKTRELAALMHISKSTLNALVTGRHGLGDTTSCNLILYAGFTPQEIEVIHNGYARRLHDIFD